MPTKFIRETRSLKVKDFIVTDEFVLLEKETDLRTAIKELVAMKNGVVLVNEEVGKGKVDRIIGVLTERMVLENLLKVEEPFKVKIGDIMDTDVLEIEEGEDIVKVIRDIRKDRPAAVIVRDVKGDFKGYFSPMDFQEADRLLKNMSSAGELDDGEYGTAGAGDDGADAGKAVTGPSIDDGSEDLSKPVSKGKAAAKGVPLKQSPTGPKAKRADEDDDDDDEDDPKKRRRKPIPFPDDDDDDEEKAKAVKASSKRGTMGIGRPTAGLGEEGCDQEGGEKDENEEEGTGGEGSDWGGG